MHVKCDNGNAVRRTKHTQFFRQFGSKIMNTSLHLWQYRYGYIFCLTFEEPKKKYKTKYLHSSITETHASYPNQRAAEKREQFATECWLSRTRAPNIPWILSYWSLTKSCQLWAYERTPYLTVPYGAGALTGPSQGQETKSTSGSSRWHTHTHTHTHTYRYINLATE